jgi:hypothetical protein
VVARHGPPSGALSETNPSLTSVSGERATHWTSQRSACGSVAVVHVITGVDMPKALSHTVVFTDDIDEALRLCTEVANLSPLARYEVAADIAERLFGWTGLSGPARAAFVGESPGALDLIQIPEHP